MKKLLLALLLSIPLWAQTQSVFVTTTSGNSPGTFPTSLTPACTSTGGQIAACGFTHYGLATGSGTGLTISTTLLNGGVFYPTSDSTTAIQFDKADGSTNVLTVDTTNARLGIGTTSPTFGLQVNHSGSGGTFQCYDPTATTGSTSCVIQAGAADTSTSANINLLNNAGTQEGYINSVNGVFVASTANGSSTVPTITFLGHLTTGFSTTSSGALNIISVGNRVMNFFSNTNAYILTNTLSIGSTSAANPPNSEALFIQGTTAVGGNLHDANGNPLITVSATASAVDGITLTNGATGSPGLVQWVASGTDSAISMTLGSKGTGVTTILTNGKTCTINTSTGVWTCA